MAVIIDLNDDSIVGAISLPHRMVLPDGGTAEFREIGQAEPAHAPRYKVLPADERTAIPDYPVIEAGVERVLDGDVVAITRSYVPDLSSFQRAIEAHIDAVAAQRGYSSGVSLASYAVSTIALWRDEAASFISWRDAVWTYALAELAKVQGAQRAVPTLDALIGELPAIAWPEAE